MNVPVFDLHCDTALALLGESLCQCGSLKTNQYHIDLDRAKKMPGYAQCFACFTKDSYPETGIKPVELFEREMVTILREVEKHRDLIRLAYTGDEVEENKNKGLMSAILTIEGPAGFGYDPGLLQDLYAVGFRMSSLGWNEDNPLTGSHITGGGLTAQGRDYIKEAQRLGMIIDTSHISDKGFWDVIEMTQTPVIASHSNSRKLCDITRNITDEMFAAICQTGGVVGINLYADFLGEDSDINTVCDHVFHFMELDPEGMHIALGGDLDGCDRLATGIRGIQDYSKLAECLLLRGLSEKILNQIFWSNAIGVMNQCCM